MAGFEHFLRAIRRQKPVEKQLAELRRRRLVLVWAAQRVDEEINRLEKQGQRGEALEKEGEDG